MPKKSGPQRGAARQAVLADSTICRSLLAQSNAKNYPLTQFRVTSRKICLLLDVQQHPHSLCPFIGDSTLTFLIESSRTLIEDSYSGVEFPLVTFSERNRPAEFMGPETRGIKRARGELESRLSENPGQATRNPGTQNHGLCALCSSLKLDALFSGRRPVFRGHVMKKLGPVATWAVDSCSLCSLLAASLPSSERRALYCHLRLFSADRFLPIVHSAVLELDRYHYTSLFVPHPEAENYVRLLKMDSIDFNILLG